MLNAETYVTKEKGIGGTIRNRYEDFYVEEIPIENLLPTGEGPNVWIWIEKLGRTTLDVLMDISRDLHISRKRMGFAGMKDKKAITKQWICISNMDSEEQFEEVKALNGEIYNTKFLKIVRGQKKLRMGQLEGNKFKILIKDINTDYSSYQEAANIANNIFKKLEVSGVPNYFGWQRFGKPRTNTHLVGKALVANDLAEAVRLYIGNPYEEEPEEVKLARKAYDDGDVEKSLDLMPTGMRYERIMLKELLKEKNKLKKSSTRINSSNNCINSYNNINSNNESINSNSIDFSLNDSDFNYLNDKSYKKAIFALPKPLQRMFVHAYQSYLFNEAVTKRVAMGINKYIEGDIIIDNEEHLIHNESPEKLQEMIFKFEADPTSPLYGTKVPFAEGKVGEMEKNILIEENLKKVDFECPKTPKLGSHGLRRKIRFKIWDASAKATEDGVLTEFSIDKGSYATAVLREIMKNDVV
ncbi:MAG: tRNA pseudouridine(13) synthase TruD [Methanobrevibacter arboriphilus]|uniref:Probable tRNA pseudouridine synthase D n=1 Tax=Methanobrevibacter arboriphilus TaxID=39441 RepID=A0A843AAF2_METAZ|nr:tRNA pseudouridine(13) synthase TruD [Methanobrevibacter arboriphilus]MBF4468327.1 tRNA pseudouridine(13) synthase TruD [Methanobrevibacter arboriphilus]